MAEEKLNLIPEVSLPEGEVTAIVERVQNRRGDLLRGLDKLQGGRGKYVKIFVNASNVQPVDTIIATARWIADGHSGGNSDDGVYSKEEWSQLGIVEVDNFNAETVRLAVEKYKQDNAGI